MNLLKPTVLDIAYVTSRMRKDEIEQFLAITGDTDYDPDDCARMVIRSMGEINFALLDSDGMAYCVGGYDEVRPKVWQTWMVGTHEGWETNWRTITKASRRTMDYLLESGRANRIQCYSLPTRTMAQEWYKRGLGMVLEGTVKNMFADGQDAVCYIKTRGE